MPLIVLEKPSSSPPAHSHSSVVLPPHPLNHPPLLSPPVCLCLPFPHLSGLFMNGTAGLSVICSPFPCSPSPFVSLSIVTYMRAFFCLSHCFHPSPSFSPLSSMALCLCIFKQTRARIENLEPPLSADIFDYITPSPWTSRTLQSNFIR